MSDYTHIPQRVVYPPQGQSNPPLGQDDPLPTAGQPPAEGYPPDGDPPSQSTLHHIGGRLETDPQAQEGEGSSLEEPAVDTTAILPELPNSPPEYSQLGFNEAALPPPAYDDALREPLCSDAVPEFASLTSDDAKVYLKEYVAENCCYGSGPAEALDITDIQGSSAYHYLLESFCESRTFRWQSEPYSGCPNVVAGPPPRPWDIDVPVSEMFKTSRTLVEVPNTSTVKPCHVCYGGGYKRCFVCHGQGQVQCHACHGSGERDFDGNGYRCLPCRGHGYKKCCHCSYYEQLKCVPCGGRGQMRWFIQIVVKRQNHFDERVVDRTGSGIPLKLMQKVAGKTVLHETAPRVYPLYPFPDQEINQTCNQFVAEHANNFLSERILQQRHTLRVVPVDSVTYKLEENTGTFFVYGTENKVYFPGYPSTCCNVL